jgi:acyl carrier protein
MTTTTTDNPVIERLREWLIAHNKDLTPDTLTLDYDLIEARAVDSLSSLEFVLYIEELSGQELDMTALKDTDNFRTLRSIHTTFLSHLTPATLTDHPDTTNTLTASTAATARQTLGRTTTTTRRPLTYSQARYWHLQQQRPDTAWNVPAITRITGPLDMTVFQQTLHELVRRHDALRITFRTINNQPTQELIAPFTPNIETIDLPPGLDDPWAEALRIVEHENTHPCDLSAGPPWYVRIIRITEHDHVCLISLEKLIADLESLLTIPTELGKIYASLTTNNPHELPPPPLQFSDFADWHEAWLATEPTQTHITHRRQQFANTHPINLGTHQPTPTPGKRETHQHQLSLDTTTRLETLAADEGATPVAIAMTAAATTLYHRFGQKDFALMMVSTYRTTATNGVLGNFTNQLPLHITITDTMTFRDLLRQIRATIIDAIKHRDLPTQLILNTNNPLTHPLAAILVNWMNLTDYNKNMTEYHTGPTTFQPAMLGAGGTSNVYGAPFATLIMRAVRNPQGASIRITTDTNTLPPGTAPTLTQEISTLLQTAAHNPDHTIT